MTFEEFNLLPSLFKGIQDLGFESPTEIQENAIPLLLNHEGDFVGQAQTGTGKTMAFLVPLLEQMNTNAKGVQSLIVAPTRELAQQVFVELEKVAKHMGVKAITVYGGVPYEKQIQALKRKGVQIVVGTPGRIIDLMDRGVLKVDNCRNLILDEADEMLNMGFFEDVQKIVSLLPEQRKIWMFSATMPKAISSLVEKEFHNPEFLKIKKKNLTNDNIAQYFCVLNRKDFVKGLRIIIESSKDSYGIVFTETRAESKSIADGLIDYGVSALALNGDLSQSQRDFAMNRFKSKKIRFLVCTDIAARGIDVSHVSHVFNMGFPRQTESYVHRIGRTGRAGESGTAVTFVTPGARYDIKKVERTTGQVLSEYALPSLEELKKVKVESELEKMEKLKSAVEEMGEEFTLDSSYDDFKSFFATLDKDEVLKVMFSFKFNRDFRQIEEGLKLAPIEKRGGGRSSRRGGRSGGPRRGGRDFKRDGGGDDRRGRRNRSDRSDRNDRSDRSDRRGGRSQDGGDRSARRRRRSAAETGSTARRGSYGSRRSQNS